MHDWKYWDEDQWKPGNITVTCKNGEGILGKMLHFYHLIFFISTTTKALERAQIIRCLLTHKTTACTSVTGGRTRDAPCRPQMVHRAAASHPTKAGGINACSAAFPRK